jgi:cysteine dioxygenase
MTLALNALFAYLDGLGGRVPLAELTGRLADCEIDCDDVAEFIRFSEKGYARNSLREGPWYHAWVMCWRNGQRSPIHDHAGSSCGVRVLRGALTETLFERAASGDVKAVFSRDLAAAGVCVSEDADIHQISNLQAGDADLVTLHIYSPPLMRMGTYSLTDATRGEELMAMVFDNAAGI